MNALLIWSGIEQITDLRLYTLHITLYDIAGFGMLVAGLTVALQLCFKKDSHHAANRLLALAMSSIALGIARQLWALPLQFSLAFGPLIYFYIRKTIWPARWFRWRDLFHFLPFLLAQPIWLPAITPRLGILTWVSAGTYLCLSHRLIERFYAGQQFREGDRYRYEWRWLAHQLNGLGISLLLWIPFMAIDYFLSGFSFAPQFYYPLYLLLMVMVIRMGVVVLFRFRTETAADAPPLFRSPASADLKQKGHLLKKTIGNGRLYEDPELSVNSLAARLDMPAHELSRIINQGLKKNFSDLINEYRVRDVVSKLQDAAYDHLTLLGIAYESGFNSKTTFNRTFKQLTGKSPAEYKNELKKERPFSKMERFAIHRPVILNQKINRLTMFRNYLKIAWRNTLRGISYSIVNMTGLAAGLCGFIVVLLYMNYELSYDRWSPELKKVYQVSLRENENYLHTTPAPLAGFLAQKYPNAEAATMLQTSGDVERLLSAGENKIYQKNVLMVDSNFLKVFPYKLAAGDAAKALNAPQSTVITKELGRKLFGEENPVGRTIKLVNRLDLLVTGVLEDQPSATHLPVSMMVYLGADQANKSWGNYSYQTYVKLQQPAADTTIETAINKLYYNERLKQDGLSFESYTKAGAKTALFVDQVPLIHNFPKHGSSNFSTVTILLVLAVLLLLAGAINFSNLAIAQSIIRAKEVGIRKVMGSGRMPLILQFMTETGLQCLASLLLAIILLALALPYINYSLHINIGFYQTNEMLRVVMQILGCLIGIILLSGLYPAFHLAKFNAIKVLKGSYSSGNKGNFFRNSLIVVQFMVSVLFISGIIIIKSQLSFMQTKDRGFSGEQLVRIEARQETREQNFDQVRQTLLAVPGVISVAKTTNVPGDNLGVDTTTLSFKRQGREYRMRSVKVSTDYFKTIGVPLEAGRYFTGNVSDQQTRSAIINQTAAKELGLPDPVGETIAFPGCDSIPVQIVGVVKNFNVRGFESEIQPAVFTIGNNACIFQSGGAMLVKLNGLHVQQSIAGITRAWKNIEPAFPLRYTFVDQNFEALFISYARLEKVITFFGMVAILISVMGLFALTAFFTRQRTKEVGVRKVLGATVVQLTALLSRDFIYLVLLAVVLVTPFTWWMGQKWLQTFAYRIAVSWWMFFAAGATAILIAIITVSFQSFRAALANPADSLRNE